jgi:DNA topoisomerase-3
MIYDLIGRRLVAALLPPPKIRKVSIMLKTSGVPFKAECQIVENEGWLEAQPWDRPSETPPPSDLSVAAVKILSFSIRDCWGCAPMPYSDASLLLAMEDAEKKYLTEPGRGRQLRGVTLLKGWCEGKRHSLPKTG